MIKLFAVSAMLCLSICYLDHSRVKLAINCGEELYYKDKSKILFRPDQFYTGGVPNMLPLNSNLNENLNQSNFLVPLTFLDRTIFQTDRSLAAVGSDYHFSYEIPLRLPGTYNLIFCFIEVHANKDYNQTEHREAGKRRFDILIENYQFRQRFDIFEQAGGQMVPLYELFEFTYRNDMILVNDKSTINMKDNKLMLNVYLRGRGAKIDAIILYHGNLSNILFDLHTVLHNNSQVMPHFGSQLEFAQEVKKKAQTYARSVSSESSQDIIPLMKQYLSPFQSIMMNYLDRQEKLQHQSILNPQPTQVSQIQWLLDYLVAMRYEFNLSQYILEPSLHGAHMIYEVLLNHKIIIILLVLNFLILLHFFGRDTIQAAQITEWQLETMPIETPHQDNLASNPQALDKRKKIKLKKQSTQK